MRKFTLFRPRGHPRSPNKCMSDSGQERTRDGQHWQLHLSCARRANRPHVCSVRSRRPQCWHVAGCVRCPGRGEVPPGQPRASSGAGTGPKHSQRRRQRQPSSKSACASARKYIFLSVPRTIYSICLPPPCLTALRAGAATFANGPFTQRFIAHFGADFGNGMRHALYS